eukprot:gene7103-7906_t
MVTFWKDNKTKSKANDKLDSSEQQKDDLRMKDFSISFSTSNGHQNTLETSSSATSSKGFKMPRIRTFENTVLEFKNIETAKSHIKLTLKKYSTILFALGCLAAVTAIIDSQITTWKRQIIVKIKNSNGSSVDTLNRLDLYTGIQVSGRSIISILSCTTCIYLYIYYTHVHTLSVLRNVYLRGNGFWLTPLAFRFIIECIICLIHVPPGIHIFPEEAQLIVFSRFYLIGRFLRQKHKLVNSKSTRFLASVTKTELSSIFLLKTYFMRRPFLMIISVYLITVALGGYGVYLLEKENSYMDTIWMLIVTMTTVGFGDFVPRTVISRAFVAAIAVIGIFLMALCISLVHESLQLTQQEKRILAYVETTEKTRLLKEIAATAIQSWWRYCILSLKSREQRRGSVCHWMKVTAMRTKLYTVIVRWRSIKTPQEDHWRKEFLGDNTAMLLTDVSREVLSIKDFLQSFVKPVLEPLMIKNLSQTVDSDIDSTILPSESNSSWQYNTTHQSNIHKSPALIHGNQFLKETDREDDEELPADMHGCHLEREPLLTQPRYNQPHHSMPGARRTSSHRRPSFCKDVDSSLLLLQNQIRTMQGNLDDMYLRSKQDLKDLENIANFRRLTREFRTVLHLKNANFRISVTFNTKTF